MLITDPDQEVKGYYRLIKNNNKSQTLSTVNLCRALHDVKEIHSWECRNLKKADLFLKEQFKKKWINNTEWIFCDKAGLEKVINTVNMLIILSNDDS
jgi:hypothetical protein